MSGGSFADPVPDAGTSSGPDSALEHLRELHRKQSALQLRRIELRVVRDSALRTAEALASDADSGLQGPLEEHRLDKAAALFATSLRILRHVEQRLYRLEREIRAATFAAVREVHRP